MKQVVVHLVLEILTQVNAVRAEFVQSFPWRLELKPKVILNFFESYSLLLIFEKSAYKIFCEEIVFSPYFIIKVDFSLDYIVDSFRMIL